MLILTKKHLFYPYIQYNTFSRYFQEGTQNNTILENPAFFVFRLRKLSVFVVILHKIMFI